MRVPYLSVGWNRQFLMMQEFGFVYDGTIVAPLVDPPFWPYTLDYKMPHQCTGKFKDTNQFKLNRATNEFYNIHMTPTFTNYFKYKDFFF